MYIKQVLHFIDTYTYAYIYIYICILTGSAFLMELKLIQILVSRMVLEEYNLKDEFFELFLDYMELVFQFD